MKRRILGIFVICVAVTYLGPSICTAADVKVMYAIGLLDYGENARHERMIGPSEALNYDNCQDITERNISPNILKYCSAERH
ncbi:MAG TPA: hypothetical protein VEI46_00340 [Thermodesulfovibrionales bacterium]|nr:hypothetical protein [Thermodesulfovibrionales bacterium]